MKTFCSLLVYLTISFSSFGQINFEQNALDHFISNLDSFQYFDGDRRYQIKKTIPIFSRPQTTGYSVVNYQYLNKVSKRNFLTITDSLEESQPYSKRFVKIIEKPKRITLPKRIEYISSYKEFKKLKKHPAIYLRIFNVVEIEGQYVVRMEIKNEFDYLSNSIYFRLNEEGEILDNLQAFGIE